MTTGAQPWRAN